MKILEPVWAKYEQFAFNFCAPDTSTDKWPRIATKDLGFIISKVRRAKKYLLIWDRAGTCTTYFRSMEILFNYK